MNPSVTQRATILTLLAVAMAMTRLNHFAAVPDASWAVFFIGGFYLRDWSRWAFPALMALAVVVDWLVIRAQGLNFWQHYCVSPAYWCLVPAYFSLWAGGLWLRRQDVGAGWRSLGLLAASVVASVALCHLVAQGSFYWISRSVAEPTLAGWWKNYSDWLPPYLGAASMYVGLAAVAHLALAKAGVAKASAPQQR
jgi:hypothetical protein